MLISVAGVDQCIQKFLDVARQTECFFLQKRLQLSMQKPDQVVKEVNCYYCKSHLSRLSWSPSGLHSSTSFISPLLRLSLQELSELRNELQRKDLLVQKHFSKLHHWHQVLEDISVQHRKPSDLPPPGPLAFLEQASANLPPAPLKPN